MKKIKIIVLLLIILNVLNVYADKGPKPSIDIKFINIKDVNYEVDLLAKERTINIYSKPRNNLNKLEKVIYNYNKNGWVAKSIRDGLLWKSNNGNNWSFSYFGTPSTFKVILVDKNKNIKVSKTIYRNDMNLSIIIDAKTMKVYYKNSFDYIKNIIYILLTTIIIELIISLFFIKKNIHNIFIIIITNIVTNLLLNIILYYLNISSLYFIIFILLELLVILFEAKIYLKYIKDTKNKNIIIYVIIANTLTALLTFI